MELNSFYQTATVCGTVINLDLDTLSFCVQSRSGDAFDTYAGPTTYYEVLTNVDGLWRDRVVEPEGVSRDDNAVCYDLQKYIQLDRLVFVRGIYQMHGNKARFDARTIYLLHSVPGRYLFEETHWWLVQIAQMADRWLDLLFDARRSYQIDDFSRFYRTNLNITGGPTGNNVQECATLSRLIYGLSSAYLLTGADRYYLAAKAGVDYQREAFRSLSHDGQCCFWAYGRRRTPEGEKLVVASENPDDLNTIPLYEQIYALAGLAQFYRITLDWEVLEDIRLTINSFQEYFWDDKTTREKGFPGLGGYFSHIDYATMRPDSPGLGQNRSRKNWNSIGDHIPAYLINLILALDPIPKGSGKLKLEEFLETCRGILEETTQLIVEKFPDPQSDFVNERFHADWTPDHTWGWQQNRAIIGHNLKISWNLTRCAFYFQCREEICRDRRDSPEADRYKQLSDSNLALARKLGRAMAEVGLDKVRGGVFDAVERNPTTGMPTQFAWNPTKDFWQQEQGILAYLIMHGAEHNESEFLKLARESTAFWNLFFLDRDRQGIFFRTTENGYPIIEGVYGQKGGHSISGYHAFELNYLAHLYMRGFVAGHPLHMDDRPGGDNGFCLYFRLSERRDQESINVLPDFFPPGHLRITAIRVDGVDRTDELLPANPNDFQIRVGTADRPVELVVEFIAQLRQ